MSVSLAKSTDVRTAEIVIRDMAGRICTVALVPVYAGDTTRALIDGVAKHFPGAGHVAFPSADETNAVIRDRFGVTNTVQIGEYIPNSYTSGHAENMRDWDAHRDERAMIMDAAARGMMDLDSIECGRLRDDMGMVGEDLDANLYDLVSGLYPSTRRGGPADRLR